MLIKLFVFESFLLKKILERVYILLKFVLSDDSLSFLCEHLMELVLNLLEFEVGQNGLITLCDELL